MDIKTHQQIDQEFCGKPLELKEGYSKIELATTDQMKVDPLKLVHGGYIFGLADYAAMIAVNDPNVVLGSADVKFLKPVTTNQKIIAEASVQVSDGNKRIVDVSVHRGEEKVFKGEFVCFVLEKHVLE